ncbi:hypothetical protein DBV15_09447 [Temnothorax longispinosus]|uniref:Uncharacterized protein n=1 Tax=Temnothorax longispinosus TaxID=300112 RepID=A0A4S2K9N1_9HYME|nr:hypothetical protein DBV15_09447 [Temnothorax longispinosus]
MSAASWGTLSGVQARRHCSINNTQPNRSQHILFTSSTHFIPPSCAFFTGARDRRKRGTGTVLTSIWSAEEAGRRTVVSRLIMPVSRMWILLCLLRAPCNATISIPADLAKRGCKKIPRSRDICLYGSRGTRGSLVNVETKVVSHKEVGGTRHQGGVSAGEECRSVPIRPPRFGAAGFYLRAVSSVAEELATDMTK